MLSIDIFVRILLLWAAQHFYHKKSKTQRMEKSSLKKTCWYGWYWFVSHTSRNSSGIFHLIKLKINSLDMCKLVLTKFVISVKVWRIFFYISDRTNWVLLCAIYWCIWRQIEIILRTTLKINTDNKKKTPPHPKKKSPPLPHHWQI